MDLGSTVGVIGFVYTMFMGNIVLAFLGLVGSDVSTLSRGELVFLTTITSALVIGLLGALFWKKKGFLYGGIIGVAIGFISVNIFKVTAV